MKILAIETSCDDTAIALLEARGGLSSPRFKVIKNLVSSQIKTHRPWGGVVPNLAKREHLKNLPIILKKITGGSALENYNNITRSNLPEIDILAVTVGPGLELCLWTGTNFAREVKKKFFPKAKTIGVNHLEGHLYSFLLAQKTVNPKSEIRNSKQIPNSKSETPNSFEFRNSNLVFPAISLLVSGGHTILLLMKSLTKLEGLGETRDDAAGECFDKVARMLNLSFPGGPEIEKLAVCGDPTAIIFPRPMIHTKDYDFSFSGLKTSVLYYLRDNPLTTKNYKLKTDVAASFQKAAIDVLVSKTIRAARMFKAKSVMLSGGVAANKTLRKTLKSQCAKLNIRFFAPPARFMTDNAAMIGAAAYINFLRKKNRRISAQANLNL